MALMRAFSPVAEGSEDFPLTLVIRGKPFDDFICRAVAPNTDVLIIQRANLDTGGFHRRRGVTHDCSSPD